VAPSDFSLFLHLKRFLIGKNFDSADELKESVEKWLTYQVANFYEQGRKTLCHFTTSTSMWVVIMSKSALRYVEFDNNEYKFCTSVIL
jgi:hypothetical protein